MEGPLQQSQITEAHLKAYERAKTRLLEVFQKKDEKELKELIEEVEKFAEVAQIDSFDINNVLDEIKKILGQDDPNIFVETIFNLVKPLLDKKVEQPEYFEIARRERIFQNSGNIKLSELMYYNVDLENEMVLHTSILLQEEIKV